MHVHRMFVYDQARAYLHSRTLPWSYGGMKGREADLWQKRILSLPLESFLQAIVQKGFEGVYIDRNGYSDRAAHLEGQLASLLNTQPLASADQRLTFYDLRDYAKRQMPTVLAVGDSLRSSRDGVTPR